MKNTIRTISAVAVLLVAGEAYSQAPASSFLLKLDVMRSNITAASNVVIGVNLTNTTNQQMVMYICLNKAVECNFEIHVRDSHGSLLPEGNPVPDVWSLAGLGVKPGETTSFSSDLSKLFDLSRPDLYEIQVERWDPLTRKAIRSNVIHVVVSAP
jgi:hypothetical protein